MKTLTIPIKTVPEKIRMTPWGYADTAQLLAPGLWLVSTPSHGGYYIEPERAARMPHALQSFAGHHDLAGAGWYEEDCDCCIVVLAFPSLFSDDQLLDAVDMVLSNGMREYFASIRPYLQHLDAAPLLQRAERRRQETRDLWQTAGCDAGPTGIRYWFMRGSDRRYVYVPDWPEKRWFTDAEVQTFRPAE